MLARFLGLPDDVLHLVAVELDAPSIAAFARACHGTRLPVLKSQLLSLWDDAVASLGACFLSRAASGSSALHILSNATTLRVVLGDVEARVLAALVRRGDAPCLNHIRIVSGSFGARAARLLLNAAAADFGLTVSIADALNAETVELDDSGCEASDGACVVLGHVLQLRVSRAQSLPLLRLNLCGNRIGRAGGVALAGAVASGCAPALRRCELGSNRLEQVAGCALIRALRTTPRLRVLGLERNLLDDGALGVLTTSLESSLVSEDELVASRPYLPSLRRLDVSHNPSTPAAEAALLDACAAVSAGRDGAPQRSLELRCGQAPQHRRASNDQNKPQAPQGAASYMPVGGDGAADAPQQTPRTRTLSRGRLVAPNLPVPLGRRARRRAGALAGE